MSDLTTLPLQIAQTVQLQSVKFGQIRLYSKLIGYVENQSIMITSPVLIGGLQSIIDGDPFICRAFGGRYALAFRTHVLRTASAPFPHLFLAYPKSVEKVVVRKATRVTVSLRGTLGKTPPQDEPEAEAEITDLSLTGAGATSKQGIAGVGEQVSMKIRGDDGDDASAFQCSALVKNVRPVEGSQEHAQYGLEFTDLSEAQSRTLLQIIQNHLLVGA